MAPERFSTDNDSMLRHLIKHLIKESSREEQLQKTFETGATGLLDHIENWTRRLINIVIKAGEISSHDPEIKQLEAYIEAALEEDDNLQDEFAEADKNYRHVITPEKIISQLATEVRMNLLSFSTSKGVLFDLKFTSHAGNAEWTMTVNQNVDMTQIDFDRLIDMTVYDFLLSRFNTDRKYGYYFDRSASASGRNVYKNPDHIKNSAGRHFLELMFDDLFEFCQHGGVLEQWSRKQTREFAGLMAALNNEVLQSPSEFSLVSMAVINSKAYIRNMGVNDLLMYFSDPFYSESRQLWSFHRDLRLMTEDEVQRYRDSEVMANEENDEDARKEYLHLKNNIRLRKYPSPQLLDSIVRHDGGSLSTIPWRIFK